MKKILTILALGLGTAVVSVPLGVQAASAQHRLDAGVTVASPSVLRLTSFRFPYRLLAPLRVPAVRVTTPARVSVTAPETPRVSAGRVTTPARVSVTAPETPPVTATPAPTPAPAPARFECRVEENGGYAPATFVVRRDGQQVATGRCGSAITVDPGTYDVDLTLEGTLDRPTERVRVQAPEGGRVTATASFETAILETRVTKDGTRAAGLVEILRNGERVGTLGSGVPGRLSAGTYEVVANYRTESRRFTVTLAPGQRRALDADF